MSEATSSFFDRIGGVLTEALKFWEPLRLVYNGVLALIVIGALRFAAVRDGGCDSRGGDSARSSSALKKAPSRAAASAATLLRIALANGRDYLLQEERVRSGACEGSAQMTFEEEFS